MNGSISEEVKNYLNITWEDDETNKKVDGIIRRAQSVIENYAGTDMDITDDSVVKQLFLDCCRYIYNDCFEDFERNFSNDLFFLRQIKKIERMNRSAQ